MDTPTSLGPQEEGAVGGFRKSAFPTFIRATDQIARGIKGDRNLSVDTVVSDGE